MGLIGCWKSIVRQRMSFCPSAAFLDNVGLAVASTARNIGWRKGGRDEERKEGGRDVWFNI